MLTKFDAPLKIIFLEALLSSHISSHTGLASDVNDFDFAIVNF